MGVGLSRSGPHASGSGQDAKTVVDFAWHIPNLPLWHPLATHPDGAKVRAAQHSVLPLPKHGTARHGTARHGTARHGTARHGTALN